MCIWASAARRRDHFHNFFHNFAVPGASQEVPFERRLRSGVGRGPVLSMNTTATTSYAGPDRFLTVPELIER